MALVSAVAVWQIIIRPISRLVLRCCLMLSTNFSTSHPKSLSSAGFDWVQCAPHSPFLLVKMNVVQVLGAPCGAN